MCAASEPEGVVVNGMSRFARDGQNANSALLVGVGPEDFDGEDPLAGIKLQREMEQAAYRTAIAAGGEPYQAPAQTVGDFLAHRAGGPSKQVKPTYARGVAWCDLHECLPPFVARAMEQALPQLDRRLHGFADPQAVLTGVPVIADIKRGDIAKTAEMYAMGHFTGDFESDFVTLAPYMGLDSISPYLPYAEKQGKGMFVLCRTSNGGAKDFEYEKLADGRHVYDLVGDKLNALGKDYMGEHGYSSIGLVIGGTHIEEATEIRAKYQDSFFLIPGYGAQGGKAEDIAQYLTKGNGGVVNSSRGILLAYKKQPGTAFDEAAYNECVNMKEAIAHACSLL